MLQFARSAHFFEMTALGQKRPSDTNANNVRFSLESRHSARWHRKSASSKNRFQR